MINVQSAADRVTILFADDGNGMSEEVQARVFAPFFTTSRASGGSGLGLYIVYNLVTTRLDGTIACRSEAGRGTCFEMPLPRQKIG